MPISLVRVTLVASMFMLGCGEAPVPGTDTSQPAPSTAKKADTTSRADEIIADLKKREAEQAEIQKQQAAAASGAVPVVVEVSPTVNKPGVAGGVPGGTPPSSFGTGTSSAMSSDGKGADYWRQEFSVAQARLQDATAKLDAAKIRLSNANAQLNDPNTAISRMARDAYNSAQTEVSQLQSSVYSAQSNLDNVRSNAIRAGVPPGLLR